MRTLARSLLALASLASAAPAMESPAVLFVLDASGSMNAKVQGKPKIDVARTVMSNLVRSLEPEFQLGLMAYGHRRKSDCQDIELVVPVGDDRRGVLREVQALSAKGETPLTESVVRAADVLRAHEGPTSVVVVSDGKESCGGDPCAAARAAVAAGVHLRIHVVGFDVTPDEAKQLQCIAREGKGKYFGAANGAELKRALAEVHKEVSAPAPTAAPAAVPTPAPTPTAAPAATKTGVRLHAVLAAGKPPIEKALTWEVFSSAPDMEGNRAKAAFSYDATPFFELAPGHYWVRVSRGDSHAEAEIDVVAGKSEDREIVIGAGRVKALARLATGAPAIAKDLAWDVFVGGTLDMEGNQKKAAFSYDPEPVFTLPAGRYVVRVARGEASGQQEVEVAAGEDRSIEIVIGAGRVKLTGHFVAGGPPIAKGAAWDVFEDTQSLDGERKKVGFSYDATPIFTLPAGRYAVVLSRGEARVESKIEIKAGEDQAGDVVLNAGVLEARAVQAGAPVTADVAIEVLPKGGDLEGPAQAVATRFDAVSTFTLGAGRYEVRARHGEARGTVDVEIRAGERSTVDVPLGAAP